MVNLLGKDIDPFFTRLEDFSAAHIHMYGKKENQPLRKMGHVTFIGDNVLSIYESLKAKKLIQEIATTSEK